MDGILDEDAILDECDILDEMAISRDKLVDIKHRIARLHESNSLFLVEHGIEPCDYRREEAPDKIAYRVDEKRLYDGLRALDYEELVDVFALAIWGEGRGDLEDAIDLAQDMLDPHADEVPGSRDADIAWFANRPASREGFLHACNLLGIEQPLFINATGTVRTALRGFAAGVASCGALVVAALGVAALARKK